MGVRRLLWLAVLGCLLAAAAACGDGEDEADGASAGDAVHFTSADIPAPPEGLNDRDGLAALVGLPDLFEVSYEVVGGEAEPEGRAVRYEIWTYFDHLTAYEFADGTFVAMYPVDDVTSATVVPNHLDPRDFTREDTWEVVLQQLDNPGVTSSAPLPAEYEVEATAYAAGQMLFVFDVDGLVYAESVPISIAGAP